MKEDGADADLTENMDLGEDALLSPILVEASDPELQAVLEQSKTTVGSLVGEKLDTITIKSIDPAEAPLLARNVSKLSPMTSTLLEHRVVIDLAAATTGGSFQIERQDPGFPDAGIFKDGTPTGHGLELKAYNVLSTEITGRFKAAQPALEGHAIYVVLIAWVMDKIIHGSPQILDVEFVDAMSVAQYRDSHYNKPPLYLVSPPEDNTGRGLSMQLRNVEGYVLQTHTEADMARVAVIMNALLAQAVREEPHHAQTAELTRYLRSELPYRLDTNFAKVDRIAHQQIEDFKARNQARVVCGKTIRDWRTVLRNLGSSDDTKRLAAEATLSGLY